MVKTAKVNEENIRMILTLRFGSFDAHAHPKNLMGYSQIARLTKIPYSTVRNHCVKFEIICKDSESHAQTEEVK